MTDSDVERSRCARKAYLRAWREKNGDQQNKLKRDRYAADEAYRNERIEAANNYYAEHRERVLAKRLAAYADDPGRIRQEVQKYRDKYAPKLAAEKRDRYAADPAKYLAACKKWAQANPDKINATQGNRRARKRKAEGSYSGDDIAIIRKAQKDRCAMPDCRVRLKGKGHVDHILALAKGGSNWPKNLQLLCAHCNISKHDKDQLDFARSRGLLL